MRHSLSPTLHNAAFAALGLAWVYLAFEVARRRGGRRARGHADARHRGAVGHHAPQDRGGPRGGRLSPVAAPARRRELRPPPTATTGRARTPTATGSCRSLREDAGFDPAGRRCLVVGAGGAARAVVVALAGAGAREVAVVNRSAEPARGRRRPRRDGSVDSAASRRPIASNWSSTPRRWAWRVGGASSGVGRLPIDPRHLGRGQIVADLIYHPLCTTLLEVAQSRGAADRQRIGDAAAPGGTSFRALDRVGASSR